MRERMHSTINENKSNDAITVQLSQTLDTNVYNIPLTLKTYIPANWKTVKMMENSHQQNLQVQNDVNGKYVLYNAMPGSSEIKLSPL